MRRPSLFVAIAVMAMILLLMANPSAHTDRVLNGPTNDVWLFPWLKYLLSLGVEYHHNHLTTALHCDPQTQRISGATVQDQATGTTRQVQADYYLAAVPLERMALLVNKDMLAVDATLGCIGELANPKRHSLNWMNGVQYYLNQDVPLTHGHVICIDSKWALTVISQAQFWPDFPLSGFGAGDVKGLLSVDVSDWFTAGLNGKPAHKCTIEEIKEEVWNQLEAALNGGGMLLDRSMILLANVDADIRPEDAQLDNPTCSEHDAEPLLVNTANSWSLRPEASTGIANFFLASDYVRTNTDLATMEGANEAARRAVNGILAASGSGAPFCKIWQLHEPDLLGVLRAYDRARFAKGLPWADALHNIPTRLLHEINYWWQRLRHKKVA